MVASRPVTIGAAGPDLDACLSNARVVGLNPKGDNFLAVRASPSPSARKLDQLHTGWEVHVCEESGDGRWMGIVYAPGGKLASCGVTSPVVTPRSYRGKCRSGWVSAKYVHVYAG
jgi:hypothetical protein